MKLKDLNTLKIGDTIYSFYGNKFYVYKITNINIEIHEITVCIEYIDNIKNGKDYSIIDIPSEERFDDIRFGLEFSIMDHDLNVAYQNYSQTINIKINQLNGIRGNLKGLKRKYMIDNNIEDNDIPDWKRLGYKSKETYQEYMNDLYDDIRHGYIG